MIAKIIAYKVLTESNCVKKNNGLIKHLQLKQKQLFYMVSQNKGSFRLKQIEYCNIIIKVEGLSEKDSIEWDQKNNIAIAQIKLSLSSEHAVQFAVDDNAKVLLDKIKPISTGQAKDRRI